MADKKYIVEHPKFGAMSLDYYPGEEKSRLFNSTTVTVFNSYSAARNAINRTISYGRRHNLGWLDTYKIKPLEGI